MMDQPRGALGRPPMLRGALTPPVRYADGGAVDIPPELAAMSYEQILALLQAQQGALAPGFNDGGDAGDGGDGDGGEGGGDEGGGGETGGQTGGGSQTGSDDDGGNVGGGNSNSAGATGEAEAAASAGAAADAAAQSAADAAASDMVAGLSADLQQGEVLGGVPAIGSLAGFATAAPAAEKGFSFSDMLANSHLGRGFSAARNGEYGRATSEFATAAINAVNPVTGLVEMTISNLVEPALEAVLGDKSPTPGFEDGAQPGHPGIGDEAYPSNIAPQGALDPTQTAAGPAPSESWLDRWMGPQQAANGGALGYANGGKVPAGAHVIPADVVAAKGNGSSRAGALAYKPLGGKLVDGSGDGRSDSVPAEGPRGALRLSRDEVVIPPQGVKKAGGHGALARDTVKTRQQFRQHLGALPPPRGSREHGKRNGGAFADGGDVEPRRGTTGQMRALYADPTREAGAYEPQGPSWGDIVRQYGPGAAEAMLSILPGSGEVMSAQDSGRYTRQAVDSFGRGDYGAMVSDGAGALAAGLGAIPIVGAVARGARGVGKIDDIVQRLKEKNAGLKLYASGPNESGIATVSEVVVPAAQRGQGIGSRVMEDLANWADEAGVKLALTPDTSFGASSKGRLEEFYRRFGFSPNKGKNKDFGTRETMLRQPAEAPPPLPMDEASRMARAKEQGFDVDAFHGSPKDLSSIERLHGIRKAKFEKLGESSGMNSLGTWFSSRGDEAGASMYAGKSGAVYPVKARLSNPYVIDGAATKLDDGTDAAFAELYRLIDKHTPGGGPTIQNRNMEPVRRALMEKGHDGIILRNTVGDADTPQDMYILFNDGNARSRFAAFDPSKRDSSDLLAGLVPATAAGALGASLLSGGEAQASPTTLEELMGARGALSPPGMADGGALGPRRGTAGQMRRVLAGTDADVEYAPASDPTMDAIRGWAAENPIDAGALALSPVPIVGDVAGLANDLRHYATDPESRTLGNYGMTALGLLPFVPAGVGMVARVPRDAADDVARIVAKAPARTAAEAEKGAARWFRGVSGDHPISPYSFWTDNPDQAARYASGAALTNSGAAPNVIPAQMKRGKGRNIDDDILEAIEAGVNPDLVAKGILAGEKLDWVQFAHPNAGQQGEHLVRVVRDPSHIMAGPRPKAGALPPPRR